MTIDYHNPPLACPDCARRLKLKESRANMTGRVSYRYGCHNPRHMQAPWRRTISQAYEAAVDMLGKEEQ